MINSDFYVLMTDNSRMKGEELEFPRIEYRDVNYIENKTSLAFLGIVVFLLVTGISFTILSIT